jgi:hypothetical protein
VQILVITFNLNGIDEAAYRGLTEQVAPAFPGVPGLMSKIWLADQSTNTYGGVYVFSSREAVQAYLGSELVAGLKANPFVANVKERVFDTIEAATRVTQGVAEVFALEIAA